MTRLGIDLTRAEYDALGWRIVAAQWMPPNAWAMTDGRRVVWCVNGKVFGRYTLEDQCLRSISWESIP